MPEAKIAFGLVGCGQAAQTLHLPAWAVTRGARLAAICDSSPAALEAVGQKMPGVRRYTNLDQLLSESPDLSFIALATPGAAHMDAAEQILARNLNLLCEKPLALTSRDAQRICDLATANGGLVTCIHNYRFKPNSLRALEVLRSGALGDVVSVSARFRSGPLFSDHSPWRWQERDNRTLLFDWALHFVDLALLFLGPLTSLRFVDADIDGVGLQRVMFGTLHETGARGLFDLMLDAASASTEIEVLGESAGLSLQFFPPGFRMLPRRDTPVHRSLAEGQRTLSYLSQLARQKLGRVVCPEPAASHAALFERFLAASRKQQPNPVPLSEVKSLIGLLDEVAKAAYTISA